MDIDETLNLKPKAKPKGGKPVVPLPMPEALPVVPQKPHTPESHPHEFDEFGNPLKSPF